MNNGDPHLSIAWGITVGLLASFVQSLGLTIQRKSHVLDQHLPECERRVEHRRPLWLLGFAIFVSSNVLGSLFQIASLPVVILGPLGAVSLLWNAFFARFLLGDIFSAWMLIGTVLIAGGAVMIALFGIVPEPTHTLDDLLRLFHRTTFIVYFSLLALVVFTCLVITHVVEYSVRRKTSSLTSIQPFSSTSRSPSVSSSPPSPPSNGIANERTPLLDIKATTWSRPATPTLFTNPALARTRLLLAVSYASVSGILSGMCLLFAKSGVELLLLTIGGQNQFWRWEAWMLLLGLLVFALLQLWYMHKSLTLADPTIVCPLAFCFYNVSCIVNGLIYFDQMSMLSARNLILVTLGMFVLLGGVWLVSFQAGNGRVDVGTWQEGDDDLAAEEATREASISRPVQGTVNPTYFPAPLRLEGTASEAYPIATTPTIQSPWAPFSDTADLERPSHMDTPSESPVSPRFRQARKHRLSFLQTSDSPSSTLNLPAGGFSIGLSPVSPGFAIVPKRRTSGFRAIAQRAAMRRAVSEGDAGLPDNDEQDGVENAESAPGDDVQTVGRAEDRQHRQQRAARARWKWLRQLFHRL